MSGCDCNIARQPSNLERLHARLDLLTCEQARAASSYLLGFVSGHVDPEDWDEAVDRAVAFGKRVRP